MKLILIRHAQTNIVKNNSKSQKLIIISHANVLSLFSAQFCDKKPIDLHNSIAMPDVAVLNWNKGVAVFEQFWGHQL